jgi:site-specific recombinase XerD
VTSLAPILESFFAVRLIQQRRASPETIGAYRTTFRLLLDFAQHQLGKRPSALDLADLDAGLITAFLAHLEHDRHNSVRTRNARLAAIRSMFRYAALRHPELSALIQQVLAIPDKRSERVTVTFLSDTEVAALLDAPDRRTWTGRRDHALLAVAAQTGLRVSELTALTCADVQLGKAAHIRCLGKGRKQRCTPLTTATVAVLRAWLTETGNEASAPVFPTARHARLSSDAVQLLVAKHVQTAASTCPSLLDKHVTPHTLRHTAAMRLIHAGVDPLVIALWLGHERIETTNIYVHADMTLKERALARTVPISTKPGRYRAPDPLLAFLEAL